MAKTVIDKIEYLVLLVQEAFDKVYNSRLFEKLNDPKTGLYFQSSGYVYSYLLEEMNK